MSEQAIQVGQRDVSDQLAIVNESVAGRDKYQLSGVKRRSDGDGDRLGIDPVTSALAVETQGRYHWQDAVVQKRSEKICVDPFHLSGEPVVDAFDDSQRMGNDGVRVSRADVIGCESFQYLMG